MTHLRSPDGASAKLVADARRGEAGAMEALLRQMQPDARRFARRVCVTSEDAEDAVQMALWQVHRRLTSLRDATALVAWIFRIVTRACLRLLRVRRREAPLDEVAMERLVAQTPEIALRQDVARAIAALPELYRTILILRDVEERTAPEVADSLGISLAAAKSRLHRARAMVRHSLLSGGYGAHLGEAARADVQQRGRTQTS